MGPIGGHELYATNKKEFSNWFVHTVKKKSLKKVTLEVLKMDRQFYKITPQ